MTSDDQSSDFVSVRNTLGPFCVGNYPRFSPTHGSGPSRVGSFILCLILDTHTHTRAIRLLGSASPDAALVSACC